MVLRTKYAIVIKWFSGPLYPSYRRRMQPITKNLQQKAIHLIILYDQNDRALESNTSLALKSFAPVCLRLGKQ